MDAGETLDEPAGETAGALVELEGGLQAPQQARRALEKQFGGLIDPAALASVELLTTELVSNAVRHGGTGDGEVVLLRLSLAGGCVRVEVTDNGSGFEPGPPAPYGEGGYGLFLVDEVSSRWGVKRESGTCAWFEIDGVAGA